MKALLKRYCILIIILTYIANILFIFGMLKLALNSRTSSLIGFGAIFFIISFAVTFAKPTLAIHWMSSFALMFFDVYLELPPLSLRGLDGLAAIMLLFIIFVSESFGCALGYNADRKLQECRKARNSEQTTKQDEQPDSEPPENITDKE